MTILVKTTYGLSPYIDGSVLLSALFHPKQFCKQTPDKNLILCDYNSLSGAIEFTKACKDNEIKPIIGVKFLDSNKHAITLVAKNKAGYKELLGLIDRSNDKDKYNKRSILDLEDIPQTNNLISLIGGLYSNPIPEVFKEHLSKFKDVYGLLTRLHPKNKEIVGICNELGLKYVLMNDCHYLKPEEEEDYKILLCAALRAKIKNIDQIIKEKHPEFFPALSSYYQPITQEDNCQPLLDSIGEYDILAQPSLPKFEWTEGLSEEEYLLRLCREGYKQRKRDGWDEKVYGARVKEELEVIQRYNLTGYFLIVSDYIRWSKERMLCGPARGSSCGSLVCYLLGITEIDPIPYDLLFERFLNSGRFTEGHIEYPDIDTDFPPPQREDVIEYIRQKYGEERVAQVATYGRMMGASILKEVLSAHGISSFEQINQMTKHLPQEAEIESELVALEEAGKKYSILQWTLENKPEMLTDYCQYNEEVYSGEFSKYFEQAIRLEGSFKSQGKHAAGIVISPVNLKEVCPMVHDKSSKYKIAGADMDSLKGAGLVKFDALSVNALSKIENIFRKIQGKCV